MKKYLFFMMSVMLLLMADMVMTACRNDDEVVAPNVSETDQQTRQMPNQADFVQTITDIGYLKCDKVDNTWYIMADYHGSEIYYDGGDIFYLYDLPAEYQKEGLKVKATLDCYIFRHFGEDLEITMYGGYNYFDAVLKGIEIAE